METKTPHEVIEDAQKSIENTFICEDTTDPIHLEKFIRSIAYMMEYSSQNGNEDCDGFLVNGWSVSLRRAADEVRELFSASDMFAICVRPPLDSDNHIAAVNSRLLEIKAKRYE